MSDIKKFIRSTVGILLCITLLAGCSFKKKDGPPPYHVDASRIHNAVPRPEPLSKYGNMPVYSVFGKSYHTLRSSKYYSKVGVASWYGIKFHERHTSSGERYNMLAMTAAHKTLPLPTYVEVTNLRNHRKIIVKVNDRGPFESNRLIDLSYVAAIKLGMIGHGTALVSVKAIDPHTGHPYTAPIKHKQSKRLHLAAHPPVRHTPIRTKS
jgi:rare lipoprotein A